MFMSKQRDFLSTSWRSNALKFLCWKCFWIIVFMYHVNKRIHWKWNSERAKETIELAQLSCWCWTKLSMVSFFSVSCENFRFWLRLETLECAERAGWRWTYKNSVQNWILFSFRFMQPRPEKKPLSSLCYYCVLFLLYRFFHISLDLAETTILLVSAVVIIGFFKPFSALVSRKRLGRRMEGFATSPWLCLLVSVSWVSGHIGASAVVNCFC